MSACLHMTRFGAIVLLHWRAVDRGGFRKVVRNVMPWRAIYRNSGLIALQMLAPYSHQKCVRGVCLIVKREWGLRTRSCYAIRREVQNPLTTATSGDACCTHSAVVQ
jgi:hypothetical protein